MSSLSRLKRKQEALQDKRFVYKLIINDSYLPLLDDNEHRFIVLKGGAGSGKSVFVADRIVKYMLTSTNRNTLVMRKIARSNRVSTFPLLVNRISTAGVGEYFNINKSDMRITCTLTNNVIIFEGMDDSEKIKSITFPSGPLTDVWLEEATEFDEDDFIQLNLRLRGKPTDKEKSFNFQMVLTFNPVSVGHWLKQKFFDTVLPNAITMSTTYLDNSYIDEEYVKELRAMEKTNPIKYQVYCLGEWGEAGDIVFRNVMFAPCPYKYEDFDMVLAGQDFGFNHYNSIELIGFKDGKMYSFRELYTRQRTNAQVIALSEEEGVLDNRTQCTADSAEPKSIADWQNAGYKNVKPAKKGPDSVYAQINFLLSKEWIVDPKLCPGLTAELRGYVFHKNKDGKVDDKEPIGFNDDAIAACRYAIEPLLTPRKKGRIAPVRYS